MSGKNTRSKSSSKGSATRKNSTSIWKSLKPSDQTLCKKVLPKNNSELVNACKLYNGKKDNKLYIKYKYGLHDITEETSPILIFNEPDTNKIDDLADGIHNFMLFWDDNTSKYTLVTSYFNAIEFGNKHAIISLRTLKKTPDTFIISGEILKDDKTFKFHDVSSQFFLENPCNIKKQMPLIYLFELVDQKKFDVNNITPAQLTELKSDIISQNLLNDTGRIKHQITNAPSFSSIVEVIEGMVITNKDKSIIYDKYTKFITSIMTDALNKLFNNPDVSLGYVSNFLVKDYKLHNQNNIDTILNKLCNQDKPLNFDVYKNDDTCSDESLKSMFNTCQMDKNTIDYIKSIIPKKKSTPKIIEADNINYNDIQVFIDNKPINDTSITRYWPNWMLFKSKTMINGNELESLRTQVTTRINKVEKDSVVNVKAIQNKIPL